jgi:polar amino acid transport system permease protein
MTWSWEYTREIAPVMLEALVLTFGITVVAGVGCLILGMGWCLAGYTQNVFVRVVARWTREFVRGTPIVVQLFFVFYVLARHRIVIGAVTAGVFVLAVHYASFTSEVYRAGIENVAKGQWEAAETLGIPRARTWLRIVLPQAVRDSVPALANYVLAMYKETALLYAIGVPILITEARRLGSVNFRYLEPYTIAGVLYLVVSYVSGVLIRQLERKHG